MSLGIAFLDSGHKPVIIELSGQRWRCLSQWASDQCAQCSKRQVDALSFCAVSDARPVTLAARKTTGAHRYDQSRILGSAEGIPRALLRRRPGNLAGHAARKYSRFSQFLLA